MRPGKIVCVGRNYIKHAVELGNSVPTEPLIFLKPPSSVIYDGETICVPPDVGRVDFEGEIGLVIGRRCRRIPKADAWGFVSGVVAVNDVTARDLQRSDSQWTRAKGLDTFCPLGNVVDASNLDPDKLTLTTTVDGEERQRASATEMAFPLDTLVSYISCVMTLETGDLIATGTPHGVGPLAPKEQVTVTLSCGSSASNPVREGEALALAV